MRADAAKMDRGYDWRDRGMLERALTADGPMLPRPIRDLDRFLAAAGEPAESLGAAALRLARRSPMLFADGRGRGRPKPKLTLDEVWNLMDRYGAQTGQWLFHGTRIEASGPGASSFINGDRGLVVRSSSNFGGRQVGVSFTDSFETARDYAARVKHAGPFAFRLIANVVFAVDLDWVGRRGVAMGVDGEVMIETDGEVVIPEGRWRAFHANRIEALMLDEARAEFEARTGIDRTLGAKSFADVSPDVSLRFVKETIAVARALNRPEFDMEWGRAGQMGTLTLDRDAASAVAAFMTLREWVTNDDFFDERRGPFDEGDDYEEDLMHVIDYVMTDVWRMRLSSDELDALRHLSTFWDTWLPRSGAKADLPAWCVAPTWTLAEARIAEAARECADEVMDARTAAISAEAAIEQGQVSVREAALGIWAARAEARLAKVQSIPGPR